MFEPMYQAALRLCEFFIDEGEESVLNTPVQEMWKATEDYDKALDRWRKNREALPPVPEVLKKCTPEG